MCWNPAAISGRLPGNVASFWLLPIPRAPHDTSPFSSLLSEVFLPQFDPHAAQWRYYSNFLRLIVGGMHRVCRMWPTLWDITACINLQDVQERAGILKWNMQRGVFILRGVGILNLTHVRVGRLRTWYSKCRANSWKLFVHYCKELGQFKSWDETMFIFSLNESFVPFSLVHFILI